MEKQGFSVCEAGTASEGLRLVAEQKPDIVLLDLGLPEFDGVEAHAKLRTWSLVPVIVLSIRNAEDKTVRLLENNADDYLTKPFNTGELIARIKAGLWNRQPHELGKPFVSGRLRVDLLNSEVSFSRIPVKLTPTECEITRMLDQTAGYVVTHGQLLREIWGPTSKRKTNLVNVYITGLRKKIDENPPRPKLFLTRPGVGYRLMTLPPQTVADDASVK